MRAISPRKQRIFPFRESIHLAYLAIGLTSPSLSWGIHEPETLVPLEPRMMNFSESLASKTRNAYLDLKKKFRFRQNHFRFSGKCFEHKSKNRRTFQY